MDFSPDEAQQAVSRAAAGVLERADAVPSDQPPGEPWDWPLWQQLGQAGLLALVMPDWLGGDGLGVAEAAALLTEVGRHAARVPALATLMTGVLPVVRWGDRDAQAAVLAGVAAGDTVLTAAIREPGEPRPGRPGTTVVQRTSQPPPDRPVTAVRQRSCWKACVSGLKVGVPAAARARWLLVPATVPDGGTTVVVVDAAGPGVSVAAGSGLGPAAEGTVRLEDAPVAYVLGGTDGRAVADLYQLAVAGACAVADGAVAAALELTRAHVAARQQFGRPLAAFQAVAQQVADVYVTARTLHLAAVSGAWRLGAGLDAGSDLDVAGYWLAEHGPAALRTCHHLHGGLGMDVSYPLHRYSALVGDLVRLVGGADYALDLLGDRCTWS
ncbi:MAG TPA: acyl-CoA dehydrogenase family protein [Streptosporangiaceae bacterium]|nr:acyl-CoA dehydrogenase family protein [Streptosporangiaceae bacterium]